MPMTISYISHLATTNMEFGALTKYKLFRERRKSFAQSSQIIREGMHIITITILSSVNVSL